MLRRLVVISCLCLVVVAAQAAIVTYEFSDPAKEERFKRLSAELRCLVCQNQSLADSNAELAQDLRRELYHMVQDDASDQEIVEFMVSRYGDFVLYRPPLKTTTVLLWTGPFILAVIGLVVLVIMIRRNRGRAAPQMSAEEQQRLHALIKGEEGSQQR